MLTAALMFGCKKDDSTPCPVSDATLPTSSAENPIQAGSAVTIQGSGFTAGSEIWLRGVATKADGDVQADVTGFTSTSITFTAPAVSGAQSVILKQNGGEWPLGKLYFAAATEILPKKLIRLIQTDEEGEVYTTNYTYDEQGRLCKITEESTEDESPSTYEIEYTENTITIQYTDPYSPSKSTFQLANGRTVNYKNEESTEFTTSTFSYGESGFLNGFVEQYHDTNDEDNLFTGTITVQDNNLIQYRVDRTDELNYSIQFTPDESVLNNLNLDLMGSKLFLEEIDEESVALSYLLGVAGNRSKCLPKQFVIQYPDGDTYTVNYTYKFVGEYMSEIHFDAGDWNYTLELFYEE